MEDRSDAWASASSSGTRANLKIGGCMGAFSQLLDWNRVLGSSTIASRFLVPDIPNSPLHGDIVIDKRAMMKPVVRKYTAQNGRGSTGYIERKVSIEASVAHLIGLNAMNSSISSRRDTETPKDLRQLLHVKQQPFVLQELLQEKRQPMMNPEAKLKIKACMDANKIEQAKRSQNRRKGKAKESRKHRGDHAEQANSSSQESKCPPGDSILAYPSPQARSQFAMKSLLSPTKSACKLAAASPGKSPSKKALLMEAAAKILEASNRSRKPQNSMRSLLIAMERRHANSEAKSSKKPCHAKTKQKVALPDGNAHPPVFRKVRPNCNKDEKNHGTESKRKRNCGSGEKGIDVGTSSSKKLAQRSEKDSNSQSRVFPYDRAVIGSGKSSGTAGGPREALRPSKLGIHLLYGRFFRSGKEGKDGHAKMTEPKMEDTPLRSLLQRKAPAEDASAANLSGRRVHGKRMADLLLDTEESSMRHHSHNQHFKQDAGISSRKHSGEQTQPSQHANEQVPKEIVPQGELHQLFKGSLLANSCSEILETGGHHLQTTQCIESTTTDCMTSEDCTPEFADRGSEADFAFAASENLLHFVQDPEMEGHCPCLLSETESVDMENAHTNNVESLKSSVMLGSHTSLLSMDSHGDGFLDHSVLKNSLSMVRLCDFSWWEREENQEAQVHHQECSDQFLQGSEGDIAHESLRSPLLFQVCREERVDMIPDAEPSITPNLTCSDEFQQSSPVSILDATFEDDSPTLNTSLTSFDEARQHLLDSVRRYELLAQMDLDMLVKYTDADSSVEEDDSSISALENVWDREADAAHMSIMPSQEQENISSMASPNLDFRWDQGEGFSKEVLLANDESQWHFRESNHRLYCNLDTGRSVDLSQEVHDKDIQVPDCTTKSCENWMERFRKGERLSCKIFFDCMAEAQDNLASRIPSYIMEAHAFIRVPQDLSQELQKPIFSLVSCMVDALLDGDIGSARSRWTAFNNEVEEIGTEIESTLFGLLLHELLIEIMED